MMKSKGKPGLKLKGDKYGGKKSGGKGKQV